MNDVLGSCVTGERCAAVRRVSRLPRARRTVIDQCGDKECTRRQMKSYMSFVSNRLYTQ